MVVSIGEVRVGTEDGTPDPARTGPAGRTRREVARGLRACALAAALAPVVPASRPRRTGSGPGNTPDDTGFDQIYRGRRIRGVRAEDDRWHVTVDGRPLHLMLRADGTWLSMVDHYCSYRTPLEAVRAAVDELAPGQRLRGPVGVGHPHVGDRHGVRA